VAHGSLRVTASADGAFESRAAGTGAIRDGRVTGNGAASSPGRLRGYPPAKASTRQVRTGSPKAEQRDVARYKHGHPAPCAQAIAKFALRLIRTARSRPEARVSPKPGGRVLGRAAAPALALAGRAVGASTARGQACARSPLHSSAPTACGAICLSEKRSSGRGARDDSSWAKARSTNYSERPRSGRSLIGEAFVRPVAATALPAGGVVRVLPRDSASQGRRSHGPPPGALLPMQPVASAGRRVSSNPRATRVAVGCLLCVRAPAPVPPTAKLSLARGV
jgi:hypothetical protein